MYFRFYTPTAVVSAPVSPHRAAQIPLSIDRFVADNFAGTRRLLGFTILKLWDHRMGVLGRQSPCGIHGGHMPRLP